MPFWSFWSTMEKDPVCGMMVDRKKAAGSLVHRDKTYYFCSDRCKAAFAKKPRKHLKKQPVATGGTSGSCH